MTVLTGIQNFLEIINANWTTILVIIGLILGIWKKISSYMKLSTEEKIEAAKQQVEEAILRMVSTAEADYSEWDKAGEIKRSEVIEMIYEQYPILSKVADQEELIAWLDELIDNALVTLREVIAINEGE